MHLPARYLHKYTSCGMWKLDTSSSYVDIMRNISYRECAVGSQDLLQIVFARCSGIRAIRLSGQRCQPTNRYSDLAINFGGLRT